jgi:signal transduction histidine kinase
MSLSAFIRDHKEQIIVEFAAFARTLMPTGADMDDAELRDHAEEILTAALHDLGTTQTVEERSRRSKGHGSAHTMTVSGKLHADHRIQHGFTFRSVLAEFRALRATVLQLYEESGATDPSEVRRFNEAVDEALTESMDRFAVQTDLFRNQFIGILSHDLRAPLAAVTAGAALLALPEDQPERRGRVVTRIMNSAQRMERMIGDLLDLTRTRLGGTIPLKRRPTDLKELCDEVILESSTSRPEAALRLNSSGDLVGNWDPDRLAQAVSNLLGNAIQYGDGTPVTLTAEDDNGSVVLAVHNGGAPIPTDVMRSIFEPLARGIGDGGTHSIGLGLFIARAIVSAHAGEIGVTSSSDQGTTFTVRLPKIAHATGSGTAANTADS